MKTTVKEKEVTEKPIHFPCLMCHPVTDLIILVTGKTDMGYSGFVEHPGSENFKPGHASDSWNYNVFEVFDGSVTLSND